MWWAVLATQGTLDDAAEMAGIPMPAVALGGGLLLGLLLWLVFRPLVAGAARDRGDAAEAGLRKIVSDVLATEVVAPTNGVLASYSAFRSGIAHAQQ